MPFDARYLDDLADADLILRFKAGNDLALDVLLRRHSDDLYRLCCRLTDSKEDAEDVYQESLARAIGNVTSLQSGSAFRGWLFRIARNLSVDSFRGRRRVCRLPNEEDPPEGLHVDGPHEKVEIGEEHTTVAQALQRLAPSHQDVLLLREVEGLSYAAIADRLKVSHSAVETLLFRARRRLREEYSKRAPGVALLAGLRGIGLRVAGPVSGGTTAAKLAVTAAVVGGAVVSAPHFMPHHSMPRSLQQTGGHDITRTVAQRIPRNVTSQYVYVGYPIEHNASATRSRVKQHWTWYIRSVPRPSLRRHIYRGSVHLGSSVKPLHAHIVRRQMRPTAEHVRVFATRAHQSTSATALHAPMKRVISVVKSHGSRATRTRDVATRFGGTTHRGQKGESGGRPVPAISSHPVIKARPSDSLISYRASDAAPTSARRATVSRRVMWHSSVRTHSRASTTIAPSVRRPVQTRSAKQANQHGNATGQMPKSPKLHPYSTTPVNAPNSSRSALSVAASTAPSGHSAASTTLPGHSASSASSSTPAEQSAGPSSRTGASASSTSTADPQGTRHRH